MSTSITPNLDSISLYYKESTSNKEYHIQIVGNEEDGFKVNFQYGRVGSKLSTGTKTSSSVDYATARKIMEELASSKQSKGYTSGKEGTPYQDTKDAGKVSGLRPQLLNFIDEKEVEKYINDDKYVMQEKKDGVRCMIRKNQKVVEGIGKKGLITSIPSSVEAAIKAACGTMDAVLDGELVGQIYWMFDLLSIGIHAFNDKPVSERLDAIQEWLADLFTEDFQLIPTAVGRASKKALYKRLKEENAEGFVFKKLDSTYKAGRPASGGSWVKFKFYATATVRVRALNTSKSSFQMEVLEKGDWKYVGDCTYYPTVYQPKPGEFCEVRYLYAYPGGSLFQPTCLGRREDSDESDCLLSQLKYKQGSQEDDN